MVVRGGFSFIFLVFRLWSLSWNCTGCVICCNFLPPQIGLFFCGIAMGAANVNVFVNLLATFVTQNHYGKITKLLSKNYWPFFLPKIVHHDLKLKWRSFWLGNALDLHQVLELHKVAKQQAQVRETLLEKYYLPNFGYYKVKIGALLVSTPMDFQTAHKREIWCLYVYCEFLQKASIWLQ